MFDQEYRQFKPIKYLAQIYLIGLLARFLFAVFLFHPESGAPSSCPQYIASRRGKAAVKLFHWMFIKQDKYLTTTTARV